MKDILLIMKQKRMKKLRKIWMTLVVITALLPSCTKDLRLNPISTISVNSFWKTENDADGGLYGMYVNLRSEAEDYDLFLLGEARSDAIGPSFSNIGLQNYFDNSLSASIPGPSWQGLYKVVNSANQIIKYVPSIKFQSEKDKDQILAEAYTMRAYCYFVMVRSWGNLPLRTEPIEGYSPKDIFTSRTPVEDVFSLIKSDINKALSLFPDNNFIEGRNRWSKPAANALKGAVYLWTGKVLNGGKADFDTALNALNEVQTSDVELLPNYDNIFSYTNKGNKEIIMAINFQQYQSGSNWGNISYMHPAYMSPYFDSATVAAIGVMGGSPGCGISDVARGQFTNDDQRKNATFYEMYITDPNTGVREYYGSFFTKYDGFVNGGQRLFLDDIIIFRYGGILLLKAEAENALGLDPSKEINMVRERAYGNNFSNHIFVDGSEEANDEAILKERLLELTFEGKRWWDLIRFGKVFEKVPSLKDRKGQDYLLLFPIPQTTLSLNPNIKQNPGY